MTRSRSAKWIIAAVGRGESATLQHRGYSMAPSLLPGDLVTVRPLADRRPERGGIVLARLGERLVAHRVISLDGPRLFLAGDGNPHRDPPIDLADVIGEIDPPAHGTIRRALRRIRGALAAVRAEARA